MVLVRIRYPKPPLAASVEIVGTPVKTLGFWDTFFKVDFPFKKRAPNSDEFCMVILLGSSVDQQKDITNHRWLKKPLRRVGRRASAMVGNSLLQ